MKRKVFLLKSLALSLITAGFVSCGNEVKEIHEHGNVIKLTNCITPISRGTNLTQQSQQIIAGQQVGVVIKGANNVHNNVAWTAGSNGTLTNSGDDIYWSEEDITIYSYHPYDSNWDGTDKEIEFSVNINQSGIGYLNSDLLWCMSTATRTTDPIPLMYSHKLAKINVELTSEDIEDLSGAYIYICGTNISTNINPITGKIAEATTPVVEDILAGITTTASTATAIIVPQTLGKDFKLIKIEHANKTYYYTLPDEKTFESGKSYSYTLNLKEKINEVIALKANITNWIDEAFEEDIYEEDEVLNKQQVLVEVTTAGSLASQITSEEMISITDLKVKGNLNGDDIIFLNRMANLLQLDLQEANIVSGGSTYYTDQEYDGTITEYVTKDNVFTRYILGETAVENIILPESLVEVEVSAFPKSVRKIKMFDNVTTYSTRLINFTNLEEIVLSNKLKEVPGMAFNGCTNLKEIQLPTSVEKLGSYCFSGSGITSIVIPGSITSIGDDAFYQCTNLKTMVFEEGITTIDSYAVWDCPYLSSVSLPNSLEILKEGAFSDLPNLSTLTIPENVTTIEGRVCSDCGLMNVHIKALPTTLTTIVNTAFSGSTCNNLYVPADTKDTYFNTALGTIFKISLRNKLKHLSNAIK
ncbi:MAG: leucine-rich repeat protein [Bacteroides sp.]|nr:leucine-rich repeat protein [Bacteroides sp.]